MSRKQTTLFDIDPVQPSTKSEELRIPRLRRAERLQGQIFQESLDERVDTDHPVRLVMKFVEQLDLTPLLAKIQAVQGHQGRNATDPRILMALWLYAAIDGVGSARKLAELCKDHRIYQWICGGVSLNYHTLSDFRVSEPAIMEVLLAQSIASLVKEGLVDVNTVAQDGMRIRASAGDKSFRRESTLTELEKQAKEHLKKLREELEINPARLESRRGQAQLRAAKERVERLERAISHVKEIAESREERKKGDGVNARASTTDPQGRRMKMTDGGHRPAYNTQFATDTKSRLIVGMRVSTAGTDANEIEPMLTKIQTNTQQKPKNLLADGAYNTVKQVDLLDENQITFYSPVKKANKEGEDPYAPHRGDSAAMIAHRSRMKDESHKDIYALRGQTAEWVNAQSRNRGWYQVRVRGCQKVQTVLVFLVLAHNLFHADKLRAKQATQ